MRVGDYALQQVGVYTESSYERLHTDFCSLASLQDPQNTATTCSLSDDSREKFAELEAYRERYILY